MINLSDILSLQHRPNFADIDLKTLSELYYQELYPHTYEFTLSSGEKILLKFDLDKFCHLLGVEKSIKHKIHFAKDRKAFRGIRGWNSIVDSTITKASIRAINGDLKKMKDKMLHFYYLPRLLDNGSLVIKYVPNTQSTIKSAYILYDISQADNVFVQIGIQPEKHGQWYFPETFLINRITATNPTNKQAEPPSTVIKIMNRLKYERFKPRKQLHTIPNRFRRKSRLV
ncbi:PBECR4 domain-containing protein [Sporosarcina sp. FSL K6-3457]|uniref:PBECR4 domain-containing protein n=1 Tax=Sporosarcina sp. FSL K6-3457 TaxID=2978204 RepID=UPI0030F73B25